MRYLAREVVLAGIAPTGKCRRRRAGWAEWAKRAERAGRAERAERAGRGGAVPRRTLRLSPTDAVAGAMVAAPQRAKTGTDRTEERRVGKEWRTREGRWRQTRGRGNKCMSKDGQTM